jgi:hypothetical protein
VEGVAAWFELTGRLDPPSHVLSATRRLPGLEVIENLAAHFVDLQHNLMVNRARRHRLAESEFLASVSEVWATKPAKVRLPTPGLCTLLGKSFPARKEQNSVGRKPVGVELDRQDEWTMHCEPWRPAISHLAKQSSVVGTKLGGMFPKRPVDALKKVL